MIIDADRNRMIFDVKFTRSFFVKLATYSFGNEGGYVAVTLDWQNEGKYSRALTNEIDSPNYLLK